MEQVIATNLRGCNFKDNKLISTCAFFLFFFEYVCTCVCESERERENRFLSSSSKFGCFAVLLSTH